MIFIYFHGLPFLLASGALAIYLTREAQMQMAQMQALAAFNKSEDGSGLGCSLGWGSRALVFHLFDQLPLLPNTNPPK